MSEPPVAPGEWARRVRSAAQAAGDGMVERMARLAASLPKPDVPPGRTQPMTLSEFLLARIAEDEDVATMYRRPPFYDARPDVVAYIESDMDGYSLTDGRGLSVGVGRVLAECEAKRRIVEGWADPFGTWTAMEASMARREKERILRLLALPYADHPDYREEWRA